MNACQCVIVFHTTSKPTIHFVLRTIKHRYYQSNFKLTKRRKSEVRKPSGMRALCRFKYVDLKRHIINFFLWYLYKFKMPYVGGCCFHSAAPPQQHHIAGWYCPVGWMLCQLAGHSLRDRCYSLTKSPDHSRLVVLLEQG